MLTQRLRVLTGLCFVPLLAASASIPLAFEQRDASFFAARSGNVSVRIHRDRVTIGGVTLRFVDAAAGAKLEGLGPAAPATYIGATTRRTFQQYPRLAIRNLYPGVNAIFYGNGERLEYDLNLGPRASANSVRLSFENARALRLAGDGSVIVETASGTLRQMAPRVFQSGKAVAARYVLLARNQVGFRLGKHDPRLPLTIDPVLVYAKYFGGSGSDTATAVATDGQGNVYVAGQSNSLDFPSAGSVMSSTPTPPLIALSDGGRTITALPIAGENNVTAIGGTPDGSILYAAASSGIYYSSNGGASWRLTGALPNPIFSQVQAPLVVNDISVDAIDPSRAYVATNRGMYSTSDNGGGWFPRDYGLVANFDGSINVASVTVSPGDHTLLYATTAQPNFLYKSTDAAGTWQILNPAYPGEPPRSLFFTSQITFTLAPNGRDLYAVDTYSVLLKSTDGGATWQRLTDGLFSIRAIHIDPSNPSNLFVRDNLGILRSTDGGLTFTNVAPAGISGGSVTASAFDGSTGVLYIAAAGGIYASTDRGATWQALPLTAGSAVHTIQPIGGRVFIGLSAPQTPFLVKLDSTGTRLLSSTFFSGKPMDTVLNLSVDAQGSAFLSGYTFSQITDGVVKLSNPSPPNFLSGFVAKVTPDGTNLAWLAVLGGSKGVVMGGMAIDSTGAAYVTGMTASSEFPTTPNAFQSKLPTAPCTRPAEPQSIGITPNSGNWAFVSKIAPDGKSLVYSTFLTGSCGSSGQAIAVNAAGEALVGGSTTSPDMPVSAGAYQGAFPGPLDKTAFPNAFNAGFVARLSAAGDKVLAGSYVGGGYTSQVNAIALDRAGNPLLTGATWGIAQGATPGAYQTKIANTCPPTFGFGPFIPPSGGVDAFVLKLDTTLSQASYLTYLGGGCYDSASHIALDASGNTWISGIASSQDFPLNAPFQGNGGSSGFISELSGDGSKLLFSSATEGTALAIDPSGFVYVAGSSFLTPIAKRPPSNFFPSVFLGKIDPAASRSATINTIVNLSYASPAVSPATNIGAVAPGEMIRIEGHNLGPAAKLDAQLDASGRLPFTLGNTRVLFDNVAAPLISVQESAIVCFVPFGVALATQVSVESSGQSSNAVRVSVAASLPQILAVVNQDGTPNSASNPAAQGSVVVVYVTGLGQTNPAGVDGKINAPPPAIPIVPVTAFIAGTRLTPQFASAAVGLVAGITQVNVPIPVASYTTNGPGISVNSASAPLFIIR